MPRGNEAFSLRPGNLGQSRNFLLIRAGQAGGCAQDHGREPAAADNGIFGSNGAGNVFSGGLRQLMHVDEEIVGINHGLHDFGRHATPSQPGNVFVGSEMGPHTQQPSVDVVSQSGLAIGGSCQRGLSSGGLPGRFSAGGESSGEADQGTGLDEFAATHARLIFLSLL